VIPGFSVWFFEYVDDEGGWQEVHMHIPDDVTTDLGRKELSQNLPSLPTQASPRVKSMHSSAVREITSNHSLHSLRTGYLSLRAVV
jgi:hypothetical protein